MNQFRHFSLNSVLVSLVCAAPAFGALVKLDLADPGDGLLTHDTDTGLVWLDLTESAGMGLSVNAILAGEGGFLAQGFRFATLDEVGTLFASVGITPDAGFLPENHPGTLLLLNLMGCTAACVGDQPRGQGLAGPGEPGEGLSYIPGFLATLSAGESFASLGVTTVDFDFVSNNSGSFLVRPIPEPSSLALFSLSWLAWLGRR